MFRNVFFSDRMSDTTNEPVGFFTLNALGKKKTVRISLVCSSLHNGPNKKT